MAANPIFPLYYNDIDRSTRDWTDEEFGCYMRLLMHQWSQGEIPKETQRLSRIVTSIQATWHTVGKKFVETETGMINKRLEEIRSERMSFLKKQQENGKKGGRKPKENPINNPNINPNKSFHNEDEIEEEKESVKELVFPFDSENFKSFWTNWKEYKAKEFKFRYKSIQSEQAALIDLSKKSNGDELSAIEIINQSIANGWKGFFELKTKVNGNATHQPKLTRSQQNYEGYKQLLRDFAAGSADSQSVSGATD